jgi:hypothetical protein
MLRGISLRMRMVRLPAAADGLPDCGANFWDRFQLCDGQFVE